MSGTSRPKFFKLAQAGKAGNGFGLLLDGKPVKTPKGRALVVPSWPLAEALAAEWNALAERIDPQALPLTRLANTAIDGTVENRDAVLGDLARYASGDLLCYRCETPAALALREAALWDPLLDWAAHEYGARLLTTAGIMHRPQPEAATGALMDAAARFDDFALTALHLAAALTGSLVVALALAETRLTADEAWAAANVDETFQAELWGTDPEAKERADRHRAELLDVERFLRHIAA